MTNAEAASISLEIWLYCILTDAGREVSDDWRPEAPWSVVWWGWRQTEHLNCDWHWVVAWPPLRKLKHNCLDLTAEILSWIESSHWNVLRVEVGPQKRHGTFFGPLNCLNFLDLDCTVKDDLIYYLNFNLHLFSSRLLMKLSATLKEKRLIWLFVMVLQMLLGYMILMNTSRCNSCLQHLILPHMYSNPEETLLPKFFGEKMLTCCMASSRCFFQLYQYVSQGAVVVQALNLLWFVRITSHLLDMCQQCVTLCLLTQTSSKGAYFWIYAHFIACLHCLCKVPVRTACGCVSTTVESRKMAAILQIIGWQRHAAMVLIYDIMLWSIDTCQIKLSADQYHVTILRAPVYSSSRSRVLLKFTAFLCIGFCNY